MNPAVDLSHGLAFSQNQSINLTALYPSQIGSIELFCINADFSTMQCIHMNTRLEWSTFNDWFIEPLIQFVRANNKKFKTTVKS